MIKKAEEIGLEFVKPDGAMYLFARVKKDEFDGARVLQINYLIMALLWPQGVDLVILKISLEFLHVRNRTD